MKSMIKEDTVDIGEGYKIGQDLYNYVLYKPRDMKEGSKFRSYTRSYHPNLKSLAAFLTQEEVKKGLVKATPNLDDKVPALKGLDRIIEEVVDDLVESLKQIVPGR